MTQVDNKARVWEEEVQIPTYGVGKPDKNPMFLEKRVYQGSTGRVYPHPVIDKIEDEKKLQTYKVAILENEFLRIEILPEIGGRIYRAIDKTNSYDFVYYNKVIKPALVGLTGPWISGGIEFNWPQHHRPNTFGKVEYRLESKENGSAIVWVSEIDRMYGTKMTAGFRLDPGKAYLAIDAQLYNRTEQPQTFLWWANPAVAVNDHTESVFPPDVTAVFDHGKRDVSRFPIATGTYYKQDYSEGVDISRYKNIPVPTSYMAYKSDFNFVGGYDHQAQAGLLHVANRHIAPGKKQWTWGNGDFGQAWDRHLTDEDGPYIELMTGVYTDNQPDFTWLQPYEEKTFTQYFMPYKNIGVVKNASIDAAVHLETNRTEGTVSVKAYATSLFEGATIKLESKRHEYFNETVALSPTSTFASKVPLDPQDEDHDLRVSIYAADGRLLVAYRPLKPQMEEVPDAATALPEPSALLTTEELYLAGLHLEQYRHATFEPEHYYLEGLKRDKLDVRINVAYGTLLLRSGRYEEGEQHFRQAIKRLTWRNPNPYDSEAYYQLGVSLKAQGRLDEAFAALYKSVWTAAWQDSGHFTLAQIATIKGRHEEALDLVDRCLISNSRNYKARNLRAAVLRRLGRLDEALKVAQETQRLDVADFASQLEQVWVLELLERQTEADTIRSQLAELMNDSPHNYLAMVADYVAAGLYEEALKIVQSTTSGASTYPMLHYAAGYLYHQLGQESASAQALTCASSANPDYCFPNSLFELELLRFAVHANPQDAKAHYYLGNLLYDKKRHTEAVACWEASLLSDDSFSIVHRNLGLAYFNKQGDAKRARQSLEKAFACAPQDARILYELDQLYKKLGEEPQKRLALLEQHEQLVRERDDLYLEYVALHNRLGKQELALHLLQSRNFHPWEGGEGKTTGQYVQALVELAKQAIQSGDYQEAISRLEQATVYPHNLGEGKLAGAQENHIYYYLGCAYEGLGKQEQAQGAFVRASIGLEEPASAMYYNDQPPEMIFYQGLSWAKLGNSKEANRRFHKLIDYGEKHLFDEVKIDYFAVSLPDFLVFEDDLDKRNEIHCKCMIALGLLGLGRHKEAQTFFDEVLALDPHHSCVLLHYPMLKGE